MHHLARKYLTFSQTPLGVGASGTSSCYIRLPLLQILATALSGRSISGRTWTEAGQVRPRWFGQDLSEVPDSGIGRTQDSRTGRNSVGWCDQNTFQPTSPMFI